jgi:hypothetical protein
MLFRRPGQRNFDWRELRPLGHQNEAHFLLCRTGYVARGKDEQDRREPDGCATRPHGIAFLHFNARIVTRSDQARLHASHERMVRTGPLWHARGVRGFRPCDIERHTSHNLAALIMMDRGCLAPQLFGFAPATLSVPPHPHYTAVREVAPTQSKQAGPTERSEGRQS